MRLFVAIDIPSEVSDYLVEVQKKISKVRSKINYVKDFHITLKFLGEVEDADVGMIKEKLKAVKFDKFKLMLTEVGFFPEKGDIRVVWAGTNNFDKLNSLHCDVEKVLDDYDEKEFKGHITLGRVKHIKNNKDFKQYLGTLKLGKLSFSVDSFKLYKSTLTSEGPVYEVVCSVSGVENRF